MFKRTNYITIGSMIFFKLLPGVSHDIPSELEVFDILIT